MSFLIGFISLFNIIYGMKLRSNSIISNHGGLFYEFSVDERY